MDWTPTIVLLPEGLNMESFSAYSCPLHLWVLSVQVSPVVESFALPGLPAVCRNPKKLSKFS